MATDETSKLSCALVVLCRAFIVMNLLMAV